MKTKVSALIIASAFAYLSIALSGCSTVEGFGKDVEKVGQEMQEASNEAQ